ncbi:putative periplasmic aspartyl protease [Acidisarcina polymorpha]|uniref:Putative periplasmic aspartyl protease n=1 Tax=Acidisarcina polymorpha TaxID=2211140 RepID=A0A2Z5G053_9BACT|nr:putative periplasmic aspartyl protease [Acidisarcina polymorpha]
MRMPLAGTTPAAVKSARDLGAVEGGRSLNRMILVLTPSPDQQTSMNNLVESLHARNSPAYHQWLTPEQFAAQFGPSDEDIAKVQGWLQSQGLNPTGVSRGRQWIEFSGTVQQINGAFATSIHRFALNGETHISNSTDVSIPEALSPVVAGVLSLNDFRKQPANTKPVLVKRNAEGSPVPVGGNFTSTNGNGDWFYDLAPADFHTIYNELPLLKSGIDGKGVSIAIAGRSDISLADVQAFRQIFGLPQNDPNIIVNGTDPGFPNNGRDQVESSLDIEWAGAAAPRATINLVESASTDTTDGIDLSNAYIVDHALAPIVSVSYGECEANIGPAGNAFYYELWQQAAAEGITVFVSTGDFGAAQCDGDLQAANMEPQGPALLGPSINGLSSTPFNVAVGGTQFNEAGNYAAYWSLNNSALSKSALGYIPEQAWDGSCDPNLPATGTNCANGQTSYNLEGGGGGPSNCSHASIDSQGNETCLGGYHKPKWQTAIGVPRDGVRDTPDLTLNASPYDDGYLLCVAASCATESLNGQTVLAQWASVGGTSASAPSMAGIMALVEQKNGAFQGQADYVFYKLAAEDKLSSCDSSTLTNPTTSTACIFNDITMGNNSVPGLPGYGTSTAEWSAGKGYDMATGLGTVNAANLVANWDKLSFSASATTLATSVSELVHGQPLPIKVSVTSKSKSGPTPIGDVALITDKFGDAGHFALDASGSYSGAVTSLPGGTYTLAARYGGDGSYASSVSKPVRLTIAPEKSTIAVHFDVLDPRTNQIVPYTGTAQYAFPFYVSVKVEGKSGHGLATGRVNILNGNKVVLSAPLNSSGTAYIATGSGTAYTFPAGASSVSVQYLGDDSFDSGTSASQQVTFQKQQISTYVGISAYDVPAGQPVFLIADIPPGYGSAIPTGTFQFYDNDKPLGAPIAIPNNGLGYATVTYTARLTTQGTHSITVGYSGDVNFAAVSGTNPAVANASSFVIVPVTGAATVTSIVQTPTSVTYGQSFSYIVTVTPVKKGGPVPTGQVTITGNGNFDGSATLINGIGNVIMEQPNAGTAKVYAQYQGDTHYAASTSPVVTTTVARLTTPVSLTSTASHVVTGQQTSLNMVVEGYSYGQFGYNNPTGTVQFFTAVDGGPPQAITPAINMLPLQPEINAGASVRVRLPAGRNVVTGRFRAIQTSTQKRLSPSPSLSRTETLQSEQSRNDKAQRGAAAGTRSSPKEECLMPRSPATPFPSSSILQAF